MKVICNRAALLEAIQIAGNVSSQRTPKPVLQCVKLDATADRLTLSATDLEVAIRFSDAQVQVEQEGSTLLPADKLRDIIRESLDDTLSIELTGEQATIRGQDSFFKLYTQNPADFPPVPEFEGEADFEMPGGQLKQLIGQTLFAVAKEGTRYAFNGVLLVQGKDQVKLVATDGRRLAQATGDVAGLKPGKPNAIIPAKCLTLVDRLISDPDATVHVQTRENQIIFHTADATLTSSLVEGQFPPFEDVIPKDTDKKMTAGTADLLSAVRRASLLTTQDSKGVRLQFEEGNLKLSSRSPESGEAEVNFACRYEGEPMEIGFNPNFMTDALKVVDSDEIAFELSAPNRPGLLKGGEDFLYVIMPVNLQ
ncbi:MAG: DNA polymerase III subunit beta [Phycisphaerae bacterium]